MEPVAVTGASGNVGARVVAQLAAAGVDVVALTRRPLATDRGVRNTVADYDDPAALGRALAGVTTLVFITSDGESTAVLRHHDNVLAAAGATGVSHVVLLSSLDADARSPFCYARTAAATEARLAAAGPAWSIARASIFAEFFCDTWVAPALVSGEIRLPATRAPISLVSRDDVADCLARLAMSPPALGISDITGPEALDVHAIAGRAVSRAARPVRVVDLSPRDHRVEMAAAGIDPWWAYAFSTMFSSIAQRRWTRVSDAVAQLTGHPPLAVDDPDGRSSISWSHVGRRPGWQGPSAP